MSASVGLTVFATAVEAAIRRIGTFGRYGHRKVFVLSIWSSLDESDRACWTLTDFKARLLEAHRAQRLRLARADLVAAMAQDLVDASEIAQHEATFHFVIDETARDPWA